MWPGDDAALLGGSRSVAVVAARDGHCCRHVPAQARSMAIGSDDDGVDDVTPADLADRADANYRTIELQIRNRIDRHRRGGIQRRFRRNYVGHRPQHAGRLLAGFKTNEHLTGPVIDAKPSLCPTFVRVRGQSGLCCIAAGVPAACRSTRAGCSRRRYVPSASRKPTWRSRLSGGSKLRPAARAPT